MPPKPLIQSERLRNAVVAMVLVVLFAGSLLLARQYAAGRDWANRPLNGELVVADLTVAVPDDWPGARLPGRSRSHDDLALLRSPDGAFRLLTVAALPTTTVPQTPDEALSFARLQIPTIRENMAGAAPDRGSTRQRIGRFITARLTGNAGSRQAPHHYVLAVLTVDGHRYYAFSLITMTWSSRGQLIEDSSNALMDQMIASAAGGRFAAATADDLSEIGLTVDLPPPLAALVDRHEDPAQSLTIIPNTASGELSVIRLRPVHADRAGGGARSWGRRLIEQEFAELYREGPEPERVTEDQVADRPAWWFIDARGQGNRETHVFHYVVQTGDDRGVKAILICETPSLRQTRADLDAVVSSIRVADEPARPRPAAEPQDQP